MIDSSFVAENDVRSCNFFIFFIYMLYHLFSWFSQEAHTNNVTVNLSFNSFHMINDGDIRGSCPEYETRKDITSEIRSTSGQCLMSLQQAVER